MKSYFISIFGPKLWNQVMYLSEIMSKKSSSFLRGPRVPIMLIAFPLWKRLFATISKMSNLKPLQIVQENSFHDQHYMTIQPKITSIFLDELGVPRRFALGSLLKTPAAAYTPAVPTYYWAQPTAVRQPKPAGAKCAARACVLCSDYEGAQ